MALYKSVLIIISIFWPRYSIPKEWKKIRYTQYKKVEIFFVILIIIFIIIIGNEAGLYSKEKISKGGDKWGEVMKKEQVWKHATETSKQYRIQPQCAQQ